MPETIIEHAPRRHTTSRERVADLVTMICGAVEHYGDDAQISVDQQMAWDILALLEATAFQPEQQ